MRTAWVSLPFCGALLASYAGLIGQPETAAARAEVAGAATSPFMGTPSPPGGVATSSGPSFRGAPPAARRVDFCSSPASDIDPGDLAVRLDLVREQIQAGRAEESLETKKCLFRAAEERATQLVQLWPGEPEVHYMLAVALGLRADIEGGSTAVQLSSQTYRAASTALSLAPDHAGAHHIIGRVHAAVMRLSGFRRFIAVNLLGGRALSGASWESAERHLALAETHAPDILEHHLELGVLFVDRRRVAEAQREFQHVLAFKSADPADLRIQARAAEELNRLGGPTSPDSPVSADTPR